MMGPSMAARKGHAAVDKLMALYRKLSEEGVRLFMWDLDEEKAATMEMNGEYAIFMDFNNIDSVAEETAVLFHEGGHASTGATHRVCSPYDLVGKHEYKAWKWAVQNCITEDELDAAVADGYTDIWALAERFNVPVDFMRMAVCWFTYGNLAVEEYMSF